MKIYPVINNGKNLTAAWYRHLQEINSRLNGHINYLDYFKIPFTIVNQEEWDVSTTRQTESYRKYEDGEQVTVQCYRDMNTEIFGDVRVYCASTLLYKEGFTIEGSTARVFYGSVEDFQSESFTPTKENTDPITIGYVLFRMKQAETDGADDSTTFGPDAYFQLPLSRGSYYAPIGGSGNEIIFVAKKDINRTLTDLINLKTYYCRFIRETWVQPESTWQNEQIVDKNSTQWNDYEPIDFYTSYYKDDGSYESFSCDAFAESRLDEEGKSHYTITVYENYYADKEENNKLENSFSFSEAKIHII